MKENRAQLTKRTVSFEQGGKKILRLSKEKIEHAEQGLFSDDEKCKTPREKRNSPPNQKSTYNDTCICAAVFPFLF